ncbi:LmeA family phospholipid-binding protein [Streptomyces sclerotialus]|uniref:LmeA family phospholipid-binding protein n=1 Tax=Streptomyces sclerotialus TaxID=1957 RepID=UPI0004C4BA32
MRALRRLLVLLVVVGVLFVAADRLAVDFAEDKAAEKIRGSLGLSGTPQVSVKGFPFLTQVASGTLTQVDASLGGIEATAEGHRLRVTELSAQFHDVKLSSDYTSIEGAASATGEARISYADLTKAAGEGVRISYGGAGGGKSQVKISPDVPVLSSLDVVGTVSTVGGDTIRLRADELPALCTAVPGCEDKVRARTDHDWKLDELPAGLKLDRVTTTRDGIVLSATGTDVELPG